MSVPIASDPPYAVFLVEDDERMRLKVQSHVRACPQLELLGSADSVAQALAWAGTTDRAP